MSRTFLVVFLVLAVALAIYNTFHIDFIAPFEGQSLIACIGVLASLCAIAVLLIFWASKRIQKELGEK